MMRISTNMIYDYAIRQMNDSLSRVTELNMMSASQKRLNKPSDDPAGMALVLDLRSTLSGITRYQENVDMATGWLELGDSELNQTSSTITSIIEKAEQAATGTITDDQREIIAREVRELYEELISLSNAEYAGQSIFAGHKTDANAYEACLWADSLDEAIPATAVESVIGDADSSILVEFTGGGTVGGTDDLTYRYSEDGGDTWTEATLAAGEHTVGLGGVRLTLADGTTVTADTGDGEGSRFLVRPSARYLGDDNDGVEITAYGAAGIDAAAEGNFAGRVQVRIDADTTLPGAITYSYSLDGGSTWTSGGTTTDGVLELPGGTLALTAGSGNTLTAGDSFTLKPAEADIRVAIGQAQSITVNNVGSEIFGGLTTNAVTGLDELALEDGNLFEVVGRLVGCLETGDLDGVGDALDALETAQERVLSYAGTVGARLNRLDAQGASLDALEASVTSHIASVEDADASSLTVELARANYIYQAVLSTQSKVMSMSLLDYL